MIFRSGMSLRKMCHLFLYKFHALWNRYSLDLIALQLLAFSCVYDYFGFSCFKICNAFLRCVAVIAAPVFFKCANDHLERMENKIAVSRQTIGSTRNDNAIQCCNRVGWIR